MKNAVALALLLATGCGGGGGGALAPLPIATVAPLNIAVVGDSISHTVIEPVSPVPCVQAIGPLPDCQYDTNATNAYPATVATLLRANVTNLAVPGMQTDWMIANEVPNIPANADFVIYEGGTNDLAFNAGQNIGGRVSAVVAAIRAQAPNASVILVGVRDYTGSITASVTAWNSIEQSQPNTTFVDLRAPFPASDLAEWPDGTHPGPAAVGKVAALVAQAITAHRQ